MAEYYSLLQKGCGTQSQTKPRKDSVLKSYAAASSNIMEGARNSTTTGVFSNDAYKSPGIATALSMTADATKQNKGGGPAGRSADSPSKFQYGGGISELNNNYDDGSLRERHSYELAQSDSLYEQEAVVSTGQQEPNGFDVSMMANQMISSEENTRQELVATPAGPAADQNNTLYSLQQ